MVVTTLGDLESKRKSSLCQCLKGPINKNGSKYEWLFYKWRKHSFDFDLTARELFLGKMACSFVVRVLSFWKLFFKIASNRECHFSATK